MIIKQISIFVENKTGRLAEITSVIAQAGIDIRALSIADTSDFGILRLIVDKPEQAIQSLKEAGMTVSLTDVLAIGIEDRPGSFAQVVKVMSAQGIGIEYMYAFISRSDSKAFVIMRVENVEKGIQVLQENSITLLTNEQVYNL